MIYSFLTIMDLIQKISKLSKEERVLLISKNCSLDQKRIMTINFQSGTEIDYFQLKYCIELSSGIQLNI